jgi:H/ACA ribonucleoprotein complex subunit 3
MKTLMFRCASCKTYTLEETCPRCGTRAKVPMPARFSPEDHYGEYRRKCIRQG